MEDAQTPDSDVVKEHFPNDSGGWLYKMQPWFEFAPALNGEGINFDNQSWCTLNEYTTTGGAKKMARYRYDYEMRRTPDSITPQLPQEHFPRNHLAAVCRRVTQARHGPRQVA